MATRRTKAAIGSAQPQPQPSEGAAATEAESRIATALTEGASELLDLSGLGLTALPEALGRLTQLQQLDVSHNQLTALPEALGQLTQLQRLDVSRNQLTALPEALGSSPNCRARRLGQSVDGAAGGAGQAHPAASSTSRAIS